jgi:hypothetical protein
MCSATTASAASGADATASGATASGATASGATASGATASGATASGATASGATAWLRGARMQGLDGSCESETPHASCRHARKRRGCRCGAWHYAGRREALGEACTVCMRACGCMRLVKRLSQSGFSYRKGHARVKHSKPQSRKRITVLAQNHS